MIQLSPHFTLEELTRTEVRQFPNQPDTRATGNLKQLANTLELVRYLLGSPIIVSSGYRSVQVNQAVGGSVTSKHMLGLAADFVCPGFGNPLAVARKIMASTIEFDQLIHEYGRWVHLGLAADGGKPRLQALTIDRHGTSAGLIEVRP